ncbi:MAG: hypothetical protein AAF600_05275 [Bacteroidota bacterium]
MNRFFFRLSSTILTRIVWLILAAIILNACGIQKTANEVNVIVYNNFFYSQKNYDSITAEFLKSDLVDSLKIVGRPIKKSYLTFQIDTLAVTRYGVAMEVLDKKIDSIRGKSIEEVQQARVSNKSGQRIPLSAISKIYASWDYYRPDIYLPEPSSFEYQDRKAIKIKLYTKKRNTRKLRAFASKKVMEFLNTARASHYEFEILKINPP